jgi:hypothetical protein
LVSKCRRQAADGTLYYFVGSDKLRFRQPVLPGDQLILASSSAASADLEVRMPGLGRRQAGLLGRNHLCGTRMSLIDPRNHRSVGRLADGVEVGPWSIVGAGVEIGEGQIGPHVVLKGPTRIGKHNRIYQFSSVGEDTPI